MPSSGTEGALILLPLNRYDRKSRPGYVPTDRKNHITREAGHSSSASLVQTVASILRAWCHGLRARLGRPRMAAPVPLSLAALLVALELHVLRIHERLPGACACLECLGLSKRSSLVKLPARPRARTSLRARSRPRYRSYSRPRARARHLARSCGQKLSEWCSPMRIRSRRLVRACTRNPKCPRYRPHRRSCPRSRRRPRQDGHEDVHTLDGQLAEAHRVSRNLRRNGVAVALVARVAHLASAILNGDALFKRSCTSPARVDEGDKIMRRPELLTAN